jgi:hypothetical protein
MALPIRSRMVSIELRFLLVMIVHTKGPPLHRIAGVLFGCQKTTLGHSHSRVPR